MAQTVKLTRAGYEKLQRELEHERERLAEATQILADIGSNTDDFDDAGLEDAKRDKARIELRIETLEDQLARADIIEGGASSSAALGSTVTLEENGESFEAVLVSSVEISMDTGETLQVSEDSPLGKAVLGRSPGESFSVERNGKTKEYTLKSVA